MGILRAAVIGVGYLGNFHAQKYAQIADVDLYAVVDTDLARAREIAQKYDTRAVTEYGQILSQVDLVSIVVPPSRHYDIAFDCLAAGVHTLVEKPVTETVGEAEELIRLANERDLVLQVGHLERFNPLIHGLKERAAAPHRIEAQRFAEYKSRGTEVDVVLDLMIHDIDIVLSIVDSALIAVHSSGTAVVTNDIDIAHARLEFENGCVAELSASRVSQEAARTMKVYQDDVYLVVDYVNHEMRVGMVEDGREKPARREASLETHIVAGTDILMAEIVSFIEAVHSGSAPKVTGEDGKRALEVAIEVSRRINRYRATGTTASDIQNG
ncbi:MAG: Gfo/Idh/MocA family oxidoreductase [Proteobacteria bacterium]|nr:Gfo/Idh/MocA family oxidoreductase [Pseudomonadota bacterium]